MIDWRAPFREIGTRGDGPDLHAQPEAMSRFNYEVPSELERIIRQCLEMDTGRRYQLAREVRADLTGQGGQCGRRGRPRRRRSKHASRSRSWFGDSKGDSSARQEGEITGLQVIRRAPEIARLA